MTITLADYERLSALTCGDLALFHETEAARANVNPAGPGQYKRRESLFDQPAD